MTDVVELRFRTHGGHPGNPRISRKFVVMVHPLRLQLREVPEHGRSEAHATFQFKRFVEAKVRGDQCFDMLCENFGRDRG